MTISTTISAMPTAPDRSDPATFPARADAWVSAIGTFVTEVNTVTGEINTEASAAATSASNAATSASNAASAEDVAVAAANFKGSWASLSGALNIPASVAHDGGLWVLLSDLADVTTSEPGVSADWQALSDLVNANFIGSITEEIETLSGTSVALDPANGTIKLHTLTGATTYTESLAAGQSIMLFIDDGSANTVTWPTTTWLSATGVAPVLRTSGYTVVVLLKAGGALYGFSAKEA